MSSALVKHQTPPVSWSRSLIALGTSLGCMTAMAYSTGGLSSINPPRRLEDFLLLLFGAAIVLSPFLVRFQHMAAQIFSRAVLLQLSCFGVLVLVQNAFVRPDHGELMAGIYLFAAGALPLAVLGLRGFDSRSKLFTPSAFKGTLLASLVFGLADTWALLFYSLMDRGSVPMLASAALMGVALFGLYRLKVWGLVVCISANLLIAGLALMGFYDLPDVLTYGLAATAGIQLLLPLPLVLTVLRAR